MLFVHAELKCYFKYPDSHKVLFLDFQQNIIHTILLF